MSNTTNGLMIGASRTEGSTAERIEVFNPATGELIDTVAAGGPQDAVRAVKAADEAQKKWAKEAPRVRSEILRNCWSILVEHTDELADLIVKEHGKPLADARGEVAYAAEFFRWNAEEAVRMHGSYGLSPSGDKKVIVHHVPVGVVVIVTPWNFPAAMITRKLAPALAAGNAAVIKPPAETPLTALRVGELLLEAGLPAGLVNVVPTKNSGEWFEAAIAETPVRMVSFTGSTHVGQILLRQCAGRVLKTCMELGGNAPFIVFNDADIDAAVQGAMVAKMRHSAEVCTAANRFYVEEGVVDDFTERFAAAMSEVVVGNGFDAGVTCGPMISEKAVGDINNLVQGAVDQGARVALSGGPRAGVGYFFDPVVLADVPAEAGITSQEIFGPVAPVIAFNDIDTLITQANNTEMGLAGYVFTEDLSKGLSVAEQLQAGMIGLNRGAMSDPAAPFGGMKQSGLGREGGFEGIYEFTEVQYIATNW